MKQLLKELEHGGAECEIVRAVDHNIKPGVTSHEPICKVLLIAPSTYYSHVAKRVDPEKLSARAKRDSVLKPEIARVFADNFDVHGVRKVAEGSVLFGRSSRHPEVQQFTCGGTVASCRLAHELGRHSAAAYGIVANLVVSVTPALPRILFGDV